MGVGIQGQAAAKYLERGVAVIPVPQGRKDPVLKGWPNLRLTQEDVANYWTDGQNIGALTGEPSGWRVDVDLDCREALVVAERFMLRTLTSGRAAAKHSHWWYRAPGIESESFTDVDGSKILEIRASGQQTLVPPSVHPSGERYVWHGAHEVSEIEAGELRARCRRLATAALIARHLPAHRDEGGGGRHDRALALAGFLLRPGRLDEVTTRDILLAAWNARGFPDEGARREAHKDLEGVVKDTSAKLERGEPVVGGGRLEEATPGVAKRLCKYWGWESDLRDDPVPLPMGLPPVAAFDFALLPGPLREWIRDIAERMQVPPDFLATGP